MVDGRGGEGRKISNFAIILPPHTPQLLGLLNDFHP